MIKVIRLNVTPVKGTRLQQREFIDIGNHGVPDNRCFYLINQHGLMFNGKKDGRLVQIESECDLKNRQLVLRFPGGREVGGAWSTGTSVTTSFYGRPVSGREVVGPWAEVLSEFVGQPVRLILADLPGDAIEVHPITVISGASIEALRRSKLDAGRLDYRRFRMLIELDGVAAHAEDRWQGRHVRIGRAVVEMAGPVPRCVVVSQNPECGNSDYDTLRAILSYRGAMAEDLSTPTAHLADGGKIVFGMYGLVKEPGRVSVGDEVFVLT